MAELFSSVWHVILNGLMWFQHEPELALFLAIAIGFWIGQKKVGPISLGGVCGTLIVALIIGQSGVEISPDVKNFFFAIFIFSLGYAGGPQFFSSLNAKGLRMGAFSVIEVLLVLGLALTAMHIFHFDVGTTTGLVAGAATESALLGTASEAISRLGLSADKIKLLQANVATAYSLTYIFGLITIVIFTSQIAPLLLRINLKEEATKLWQEMEGDDETAAAYEDDTVLPKVGARIYEVTVGAGHTVKEIHHALKSGTYIERITRRGRRIDVTDDTVLKKGDFVLVMGPIRNLMCADVLIGIEKGGNPSLNRVMQTEEFVLNNRRFRSITVAELRDVIHKQNISDHVYISQVSRNGHIMPLTQTLALQRGDRIRLSGIKKDVFAIGDLFGAHVDTSTRSNFIYIGIGIVLGILIGRVTLPLGPVNLALGTGGGALLTGLIFGWAQLKRPQIASTPPAALGIMKDLGLAAFVACIGLSSGKQAIQLMGQYGAILPVTGIVMVLVPASISLLVGRLWFKMQAPILLGAIAGQQCSTPALSAVQMAAGNTTPLIGYTITYAISNVLLPLLGPVIVGIASVGL